MGARRIWSPGVQGRVTPASDVFGLGVLLAALASEADPCGADRRARQAFRFQASAALQLDAGRLPPAGQARPPPPRHCRF